MYPNQEYSVHRLAEIARYHKALLGNRTSVTLVGIPKGSDLFKMIPPLSYLEKDDGLMNLRSIVEICYMVTVRINGQTESSPVYKIIQEESGRWRLISKKENAKALLEWTHNALKLLGIYIVEVTGDLTPTVTMDGKIAEGHVLQVRQEKMMTKKVTVTRETPPHKQGEEGGNERRRSSREDQGESNTDNGGRGDAARWDTSEWDADE